jgi:hypothetical protein
MNSNMVQFPTRSTRDMYFWNILATDPQELADFQHFLDTVAVLLPELSREALVEWHGAGPAPRGSSVK